MQNIDILWLVVRTIAIQILLEEYIAVFLAQYSGGAVFAWFLAIAIGWTYASTFLLRWVKDLPAYSSLVAITLSALWILPLTYLRIVIPPLVRAAAYSWVDLTVIVFLILVIGSDLFYLAQSLLIKNNANERGGSKF